MSVPLLEAIADGIYKYEGNGPTQRAYRNRNPGNLRPTAPDQPQDAAGYRIFASFREGYLALLHDLASKMAGLNKSGLNMDSSLLSLFMVYAPRSDRNDPERYAKFVAAWLRQVYGIASITEMSTFRELYNLLLEKAPDVVSAA